MTIKIVKLKSGFFAVFVDGEWFTASCGTLEAAKAKANDFIKAENARQSKQNRFININIEYAI